MTDEGVTIVLDFVGTTAGDERDQLSYSTRRTTSSRTPGRVNVGTVVAFTRRVIVCPLCKWKRMDFDGPHGLLNTTSEGVQRDCIGRLYRHGVLCAS